MLASSVPATGGFGSCREKRASVVLLHKLHIILPSFQKYWFKQYQFTFMDDMVIFLEDKLEKVTISLQTGWLCLM